MTSPDQDQISLDELFAAVGVNVPSNGSREEKKATRASRSTAPDTTEQDLLNALGIFSGPSSSQREPRTVSSQPEFTAEERHDDQKARANQWREEIQAAHEHVLPEEASDEALTQPLQASIAALPRLTGDSIRPFGSESSMDRIGTLESAPAQGAAAFQTTPGQPAWAQPSPQAAAVQQPMAQPGTMQPFQQPQAAFQQAQQTPLQPLQPVDQPVQQAAPQAQPTPLPMQPLQQAGEATSFQSVEQQVTQAAAQQPFQPQPGQQPQQPQLSGAPQQPPSTASLWQQQMAQQVSAITGSAPDAAEQPQSQQSMQPGQGTAPEPLPQGQQPPSMQQPQPQGQGTAQQPQAEMAQPTQPAQPAEQAMQPQQPMAEAPRPTSEAPVPPLGSVPQPIPGEGPLSAQAPMQPQSGLPLMQPAVAPQPPSGEALAELEKETKSSKVAHVVGGLLIFIAVICVVFAVCLLTGVIDLSAANSNSAARSASNTTLSGQAAPSATSPSSEADSSAMTSQSGSKSGEVVYSYVVRGVDGGTHEAVETATFGEDGKLVSSTLEIQTESQMDSEKLLDQLKQEFGESLVDSTASEDKVICTVKLPRDDLDRESYTELLSTNAPEFKVLSS